MNSASCLCLVATQAGRGWALTRSASSVSRNSRPDMLTTFLPVVNCCIRYSDLAPLYPLPQEGDYEAGYRRAPACLHAAAAELYSRARRPLTDAMITLIHLSDIHFSPRDDLSQFDLDQQIRRAVLEDLEQKPSVLGTAKSKAIRDWAMVLTTYSHGLRAAETCGLKISDLDLRGGVFSVKLG
jgi:integrase